MVEVKTKAWQPNTRFSAGAYVLIDGAYYFCVFRHVSGDSFEADLEAGFWKEDKTLRPP